MTDTTPAADAELIATTLSDAQWDGLFLFAPAVELLAPVDQALFVYLDALVERFVGKNTSEDEAEQAGLITVRESQQAGPLARLVEPTPLGRAVIRRAKEKGHV